MRAWSRTYLVTSALLLAFSSSAFAGGPPGQAGNFDRGLTTLVDTQTTTSSEEVVSSSVETRSCGGPTGRTQERTVTSTATVTTTTTTTTTTTHRGAPGSNGKVLSVSNDIQTETHSSDPVIVIGDWGPCR